LLEDIIGMIGDAGAEWVWYGNGDNAAGGGESFDEDTKLILVPALFTTRSVVTQIYSFRNIRKYYLYSYL